MCERWRQETFFKYLREECALAALVEYAVERDNSLWEVPNPAWRRLDDQVRKAREDWFIFPAEYGLRALVNLERQRPTMRGFKIAHGKLAQKFRDAADRCRALERKRAIVPKRLPLGRLVKGPVIKMGAEGKLLSNIFKMIAFQTETKLVGVISPPYRRAEDEGRSFNRSSPLPPTSPLLPDP
jgi:hypothetical protein